MMLDHDVATEVAGFPERRAARVRSWRLAGRLR